MEKIQMTEREKEVVTELNHELYTVEYLEHWINRNDSVALNTSAGIIGQGCKVILLLIVFVFLIYVMKNLVKGLQETEKEV